ncbi:MAG: SpoIIIAH-like family protein [Firmicutes bacterium]|nr:SpoIIIAH-like family protein [Bacillota bacterium]
MEIVEQQPEVKTKRRINFRGAFTKRRKMMILAGMFVLLIVTGYLNFTLNNRAPEVGGDYRQQQHVFQIFRQTRTAERTSQLAILENIALSTSGYSEQARLNAETQKLELLQAIAFETAAENLILALGFQDAIVSKNGGNINVLVRTPENLTPVQVTQIRLALNSVANRTIDIDNIFVSPIE